MLAHFNTLEPFQDQVPRSSIANFLFLSRSCGRVGCSRHVRLLALGKRERVNRCRMWVGSPNVAESVGNRSKPTTNYGYNAVPTGFFFLSFFSKLSAYISLTSPVLITTLELHPLDAE